MPLMVDGGGGLTARDYTDQRNDAMREGVKALFLMNGGGAVALLAFLQAVWIKEPALVKHILWGLAFLMIGVALAGLVSLFRVHTANAAQRFSYIVKALSTATPENYQAAQDKMTRYQRLYFTCAYGSLVCFVIGVVIVLVGAAVTPTVPSPSGVEY